MCISYTDILFISYFKHIYGFHLIANALLRVSQHSLVGH